VWLGEYPFSERSFLQILYRLGLAFRYIRVGQWKRDFDSLLAINRSRNSRPFAWVTITRKDAQRKKPTPLWMLQTMTWQWVCLSNTSAKAHLEWECSVYRRRRCTEWSRSCGSHRTTAIFGGLVKDILSITRCIPLHPSWGHWTDTGIPLWVSMMLLLPLLELFNTTPDLLPFNPAGQYRSGWKNTAMNEWQRQSETFKFAKWRCSPDMEFNIVLWHAVKGDRVPFPVLKGRPS